MSAPEAILDLGGCKVVLLGTITGFVPEAARVRSAFEAHKPDLLALGIPPEDLTALELLEREPESFKEMAAPDDLTGRRLELLKRFGEIKIPSPDLEAAFGTAKAAGVRIEALDLDDRTYSDEYTSRVKFRHVVQSNLQRKRLLKKDFGAADAYAFDASWDEATNDVAPLRELERLRETTMAERLATLAKQARVVLAVVPAARLAGIHSALRATSLASSSLSPGVPPQG